MSAPTASAPWAAALAALFLLHPVSPAAAQTAAETRYVLVEVGGRRLPAETDKEWRCREEVTAGTLLLRDDGRWRLETDTRETCGDRVTTDRDSDDGTLRREGATLRFLEDDGTENRSGWSLDRELELEDLDTGTMGDGGTLTVRLADEKTTLLFQRQGS